MILFYLQILTTFIGILWFDVFGIHRKLLSFLGKKEWDDLKPFTCFFCLSNWIGVGLAIGYGFASQQWIEMGLFIVQNVVVTRILDVIFGYDSIKEK